MSPTLAALIWIAVGLALLIVGGELLVRGASAIAVIARISPLVIGLTVVAFGTSAPELAVSVQSAYTGEGEIAIGNVVGSNIANVLLILGLASMIAPMVVSSQLIRFDVPLMVAVSGLLYVLVLDGSVGRFDGILLFSLLIAYLVWSFRKARQESPEVQREFAKEAHTESVHSGGKFLTYVALVIGGLVSLSVGAKWLVGGAVEIATLWGVSEIVIGLTIVAVGTSLPEVVTSIMASLRGARDLAVGNIVGSNLFNILAVLGIAGSITPGGVPVPQSALQFDLPVMIAVAAACLPIFFTGNSIGRWEGAVLFSYYCAYNTLLVLIATEQEVATQVSKLMLLFVIPLTVIGFGVSVYRAIRLNNHAFAERRSDD